MAVATGMVASVMLGTQAGAAAAPRLPDGGTVTITAQLPDQSGAISAKDNTGVVAVTKAWEKMHPGVTIDWQPVPSGESTPNNATIVTQASGGAAPDIIFEETGPVDTVPAGILADLGPFLHAKDPYDPAYGDWLDTFNPSDPPYMVNANGVYVLINASLVEVGPGR